MVSGKQAFIILPESRAGPLLRTASPRTSQPNKPFEGSPAALHPRRASAKAQLGDGKGARVSDTPKGKGLKW